jgi:hypothetical protein
MLRAPIFDNGDRVQGIGGGSCRPLPRLPLQLRQSVASAFGAASAVREYD